MDAAVILRLTILAEAAIEGAMAALPQPVQTAAAECPVFFTTTVTWVPPSHAAEDYDCDVLGLFTGSSRLDPPPADPSESPRITLFLDVLWDWCEEEEHTFHEECATTWLHELGHYLGWDEEEVAARGLE